MNKINKNLFFSYQNFEFIEAINVSRDYYLGVFKKIICKQFIVVRKNFSRRANIPQKIIIH